MSEEQLDQLADLLEQAELELTLDQDERDTLIDAFVVIQGVKMLAR